MFCLFVTFYSLKAVASLCHIADILPEEHLEKYFVPLLKRLTVGDWFTSRTSATGLYVAVFKRASDPLQTELKT